VHALPPGASLAGRPHVLRSPWLTPCGLSSSLLYPATRALSWKSDDAEFRNAIRAVLTEGVFAETKVADPLKIATFPC
jgi:hypothetical protein